MSLSPEGFVLVAEMLANTAIDLDAIMDQIRREPYWQAAQRFLPRIPCHTCGALYNPRSRQQAGYHARRLCVPAPQRKDT